MKDKVISIPIKHLIKEDSYIEDFFTSIGIKNYNNECTLEQIVETLTDEFIDDCGLDREEILNHFQLLLRKWKS